MAIFPPVDVAAARAAIRKGIDEGLSDEALLALPILSPLPDRTRRRHISWVRRQARIDALPPGVEVEPEYRPLFPDPETGVMSRAGYVLSAMAFLGVFLVGPLSCEPTRQLVERRVLTHLYGADKYDAGLRIQGRIRPARSGLNIPLSIPHKLSDGQIMPLWASNAYIIGVNALVLAGMATCLMIWWCIWGGRDERGGWRDLWERLRPPRRS
jgi:hypothetical protein